MERRKIFDSLGKSLTRSCSSSGIAVSIRHPTTASDFVNLLNGYSGVVAYRLHACVVAVSCGVPTVGLAWDDKVRAFFHEIGLPENIVPSTDKRASIVAERLSLVVRADDNVVRDARERLMCAVAKALRVGHSTDAELSAEHVATAAALCRREPG